jgi:hypothetical protein
MSDRKAYYIAWREKNRERRRKYHAEYYLARRAEIRAREAGAASLERRRARYAAKKAARLGGAK